MNATAENVTECFYKRTSRHYDPAYDSDPRLHDIEFWRSLASATTGPLLEIACGTGRVLLTLARDGHQIDGIDRSESLLNILKQKLALESATVHQRVSIVSADMRNFRLPKTYSLVIAPFRPLQHLLTVDDQIACFESVRLHLSDSGRFAFNVFYPNYQLLDTCGEECPDLQWIDPSDSSIRIERSFVRHYHDKLSQLFTGEFIFRSYKGTDCVKEEREAISMSYYGYQQLLTLFKHTGFEIVEQYGSFTKDPIGSASEMVFVLRRIEAKTNSK